MKKIYTLCLMFMMAVLVAGCGATDPNVHITTAALPTAQMAAAYVAPISVRGGLPPYSWTLEQGRWPAGVALDTSNGTVNGAPTETGNFPVTVSVTDSSTPPQSYRHTFTLDVSTGKFEIVTNSLPSGTESVAYSATLTASNGVEPYTWSVRRGRLGPGLTFQTNGQISGIPTTTGTFPFEAEVKDSKGHMATANLSLTVGATTGNQTTGNQAHVQIQITTTTLPNGAVSVAYGSTLAATSGVAPYTWSLAGGQLPPGLSIQPGGSISGTPSQSGTFSFTVEATDSSNTTGTANFSINIAGASAPVVNGISPSSGPISGGTTVTISGANFASGAAVTFGGTAASSITVSSSSQIVAVSPSHIAGSVAVMVSENGQSSTAGTSFTYNALSPTITGISPNNGPTAGGTNVTISGTNFLAGALVLFGTVPATNISVASATQIQAVAPANAAGPANVTVQDPGNLNATLSGGFSYGSSSSGVPTITSVSPTSGTPGTVVTITGTNFASADVVSFGSANAPSSTFVSATQLTATVPTISAGTYNVTVTDPDPATVTLNNGFVVTAAAGGQSLLSGCSYIGTGGCALPAGWTLVAQQDFECSGSHAIPANPSCGTLPAQETTTAPGCPSGCGAPNNFETVQNHTPGGTYGFGGLYAGDGAEVDWIYGNGTGGGSSSNVGSFGTLYMSWWEYTDPNAKYGNSDYYMNHIVSPNGMSGCHGLAQDFAYDAQPGGGGGSAPTSTAEMLPISNGDTSNPPNCQGFYQYGNGDTGLPMMAGTWRQVEILYTPSTSVGPAIAGGVPGTKCLSPSQAGCGNGTAQLFINGQLSQQSLNANLNGTVSMANSSIAAGGATTDTCDAAENIG